MKLRIPLCAGLALALFCGAGTPAHAAGSAADPRAEYRKQLQALLTQGLAGAEERLDAARRGGNIPEQASARTAIRVYGELIATVDQTGTCEVPEEPRRDLRAEFSKLAEAKRKLDETLQLELDVQAADPGAAPERAEPIAPVLPGEPSAGTPPAAGEPTPGPGPATPGETPPAGPVVLAESGESARWITVARWFADVPSMDVVSIPLAGVAEMTSDTRSTPIAGESYKTLYVPERTFVPGNYQFRLMTVPPRAGVELMAWPSAANKWAIEIRLRPGATVPSPLGFELQVGGPDADRLAAARSPDQPSAPLIRVPVQTEPPGVYVWVDGVQMMREGTPLVTPCELELAAGPHDISLRKLGLKEAAARAFEVREGASISVRLYADPRVRDSRLKLAAPADWFNTGVVLRKGDRVRIRAAGEWTCGSKNEPAGPEGYPNDAKFFHYYLTADTAPRQTADAPYGALLYRVGSGQPKTVTAETQFAAPEDGRLFLDINERTGPARKDNSGFLDVQITVVSGS